MTSCCRIFTQIKLLAILFEIVDYNDYNRDQLKHYILGAREDGDDADADDDDDSDDEVDNVMTVHDTGQFVSCTTY